MSRRTVGVIGLVGGLLLVGLVFVLLLRGIWQEQDRQQWLEDQIAPLEIALASQKGEALELPTRQAELQAARAEQATVQAELVAARLAFPSEVDSTEVLAHVVTAAAIHDVNLRQLQARAPMTVTVEERAYLIYAYDVKVEGEMDRLSAFLTDLESGPVETMSLDQLRIEALPTPTPGALSGLAPSEGPEVYQASLVVMVRVRLAGPDTTPLPPGGTPIPPELRAQELETLLEQARQAQDWERAISLLLALRQVHPTDPALDVQLVEAYVLEGQRRLAAGQYELAGADFRAALALQPDNWQALTGLTALAALTPTVPPTATYTPTPTETPTETPTPSPTLTPTVTLTPMPYYVLHLSSGPNTRYPDLGCRWFGFAGKVVNAYGYPVVGARIRIWSYSWSGVWTTTTASGEYEQYLDDNPRQEQWLVQLYEGDVAVSDVVTVDSRADCGSMLIRMDWQRGY